MRRSHPIHKRCNDAYDKLRMSDWLIRLRYQLFAEQEEIGNDIGTNVYAVYDTSDAIKIGIAGNMQNRFSGLQGGNPLPLTIIAHCPGTKKLEQFFHAQLDPWRIRGEWFRATDEVLAVASLIAAGEDLAIDLREGDDTADCFDTIGHLTWDFEEAKAAA